MNYTKMLEGKRAMVTAGAHGMGYAIAKLFARHGAMVAVCGRAESGVKSGEALNAIQPGSFFYRCDVSIAEELDGFCEEILRRWGYVDIIVNCVGINMRQFAVEISDDKFEKVQATNMKPIIRINRYMVPKMIERGQGGSIISISSVHGTATVPMMGSYAASKGAMQGFTRLLANELSPYGIRANVLAPGGVYTMPALIGAIDWMEKHPGESYRQMMINRPVNPDQGDGSLGGGHAEDIANHCLFLASDMSSYITGQTILADGGAAYAAHKVPHFPYPDYFEEISRAARETYDYPDTIEEARAKQ